MQSDTLGRSNGLVGSSSAMDQVTWVRFQVSALLYHFVLPALSDSDREVKRRPTHRVPTGKSSIILKAGHRLSDLINVI